MDYIADEMTKPTIFLDIEKLNFDYVPEDMPHREDELKSLARIFAPILQRHVSENVFIHGKVGTGKTAMAKKFGRDIQKYGEDMGKVIKIVHINCRRRKTEASVMLKIIQHFQPSFPDRGFSVDEILDSLKKHLEKNKHLIIILDEVDVFLKKSGPDLIYLFTRFDEEDSWVKGSISLILISQQQIFDLLDAAALSSFKRTNVIECKPYKLEELKDILNKRVVLAFKNNSVEMEAIDLIADIASSEGDARLAIELLWKAGLHADDEHRKTVTPEDVREAKTEITTIYKDKINDLNLHEKFTLLAVARLLAKGGAYRPTGDVEKLYGVICEEYSEKARGHTQFWGYLKDLSNYGLLKTKRSGEGIIGNTTIISLPDIPAKKLVSMLEKNLDRENR